MSAAARALVGRAEPICIRFVEQPMPGDIVLAVFKDPAPLCAILASTNTIGEAVASPQANVLEVVLVPSASADPNSQARPAWRDSGELDIAPPIFIKYRSVEVTWRPRRVSLQCDPEQVESLLSAIVEFTHYEYELRRIEEEIASAWPELDEDRPLAFEVTPADLDRCQLVGARMDRALRRRMRHARIEPHLYHPSASLSSAAQKLGEELREKVRTEARLETVDGQIEVFEHVYEMSSQRIGEYRAAREEHILEWVIIVLLAAEALLMLLQTAWKLHS